jgi:hypothetical protein
MITKEKTILDILNSKCEKQLMRLYFIGKVRAKKILDYNKKINNINELKQILNISNQTITKIRKTPLKSESKKTKQHENETKQLEEFKRGLCNYGIEYLESWGCGSKNKKENKNTDDTVKIIDIKKFTLSFNKQDQKYIKEQKWDNGTQLTINRKTNKGSFTWLNGGIGSTCSLSKYLLSNTEKCVLKKLLNELKSIKDDIGIDKNWKDIKIQKIKCIEIIYKIWSKILKNKECKFYKFYNERLSDLDLIGNTLSISYKKKYNKNIKIEKDKDNNIKIGDLKIRFKAEGSKVNSSFKMNFEYV